MRKMSIGKWGMALVCGVVVGFAAPPAAAQSSTQAPEQVNVTAKIIEFQSTKGVETGLSAYFQHQDAGEPVGRVSGTEGIIESADITFPARDAAITVFLDRLTTYYGDIEMVLQALVDENRAFILARPRAMVRVGAENPTEVKTVRQVPYENTVVVGNTPVQITDFRDTGVTLNISVPEVINDGDNWTSRDDTYIKLDVTADVKEEGQRIVVALDNTLAQGGDFSLARNSISAPEFISRSITTSAWVRDGQVLVLGGLYRNVKTKQVDTVPWLTQAEDTALQAADNFVNTSVVGSPVSSLLGGRSAEESRRELVFMIKAEAWRPAFTVAADHGFGDVGDMAQEEDSSSGTIDMIRDVVEGLRDVPRGFAEGIIRGDEEHW
ncbi:MAG: type II secretion system protein GspD [Candidatus Hydrogenedentota bacterium]